MKSHTGAVMSLGKGAAYSSSSKQKLNTKSSTETELVAVDDKMPQIVWTQYFMEAQGYKIRDNVAYQDNQSAMLLKKNRRGSSSKRTRHINIRYYFVTDRIAADELRVEYCPTDDMHGDYFTKAVQGKKFKRFWNFVLGIDEKDTAHYINLHRDRTQVKQIGESTTMAASPQECVGDKGLTDETDERKTENKKVSFGENSWIKVGYKCRGRTVPIHPRTGLLRQ